MRSFSNTFREGISPFAIRQKRQSVIEASLSPGPADARAESRELLFHPVVAAVQVIDALDSRLAFRCEAREDERGRSAQVARHHLSTRQARRTFHDRPSPFETNVRSHPLQLGHV